jgi:sigma-E factor negative regulatory protein RseB
MHHGIRSRLAHLVGALLLTVVAVSATAGQPVTSDARGWILRMNKMLVEGNFDGVFQLRGGDKPQDFRIVHRFKDGEMIERVVSTDGSGYEQKRQGSLWREFLPNKRRVVTATRTRSFGYIHALNGIDSVTERHYAISDAGRTRLLGRDVQMIHVEPRDNLRFGYRFWLDAGSAMPLKLQRIAHDGKVVKEITFTYLNAPLLPTDIADEQLTAAVDATGFTRIDRDRLTPFYNPGLKRTFAPQATLLPPGYRARRFGGQGSESMAAGARARYIVTDGVTWAEVFLAPATGEPKPAGGGMMGAFAGYELTLEGVRVSVVGEMPLAAAQAIAQAFRPE